MGKYFSDMNYFQLLMGLRSFQKSEFLKANYSHIPIPLANELWNFGSTYFNANIDLYIRQHDLKSIFWKKNLNFKSY